MPCKPPFVGCSRAHTQLLSVLDRVAPTEAEILITGPTGVGKERYAQYIHEKSSRNSEPFVPINCGAFPGDLFENEMFGHVGGAFTGARPNTDGLVAEADHGTLFLDEVDSLPLSSQVKLLRLIQEREYRRLGDTRLKHVDLRVVAATNSNLVESVKSGRFREDLFFRLRVVPVDVPPLCKRPDDIPLLLDTYINHYADRYRLPGLTFSKAAYQRLMTYGWPGNVRELENCVRYLTCLQLCRPTQLDDLPLLDDVSTSNMPIQEELPTEMSFQQAKSQLVDEFERKYLETALRDSRGNIATAAAASGKARRVFFELLRKHGIKAEDFRQHTSEKLRGYEHGNSI